MRREALAVAAAEPREPVHRVRDVDADGVPCRLYIPDAAEGVVVFLHGGGFVFGDIDTHDAQSRRVANRTGCAVLTVGYRRPPEHRFPAAPQDVDRAVAWLRSSGEGQGLRTDRLVALGDSAGGNLALVAALRNPGVFSAMVLIYPFLDPDQAAGTYRSQHNLGLTAAECRWFWEQYAASAVDLREPDLAPLLSASLGGLPATLIQSAEHDVLLGEDLVLVQRIADSGGTVVSTTYPGMIHGFWRHPEMFDAAEPALAEAAGFLRRHL
ncbi:MAG: alpha/beta hydrolase [Nocardioidaceae bacterium]|nr:alpha/beta hydrolase [Nocardioidaceae bacterium]